MRESDEKSGALFSYVELEARIRRDHPLRTIRPLANEALAALQADFSALYSGVPTDTQAHRGELRLDQDHRRARGPMVRGIDRVGWVHLRRCGLQPGPAAQAHGRSDVMAKRQAFARAAR